MESKAVSCPKCGAPLHIEDAINDICLCVYCGSRIIFTVKRTGETIATISDQVVDIVVERVYLDNLKAKIETIKKRGDNQAKEELQRLEIAREKTQSKISDAELAIVFSKEYPHLANEKKLSVAIINLGPKPRLLIHELIRLPEYDKLRSYFLATSNEKSEYLDAERYYLARDPGSNPTLIENKKRFFDFSNYLKGLKTKDLEYISSVHLDVTTVDKLMELPFLDLPFLILSDIPQLRAYKVKSMLEKIEVSIKLYPSNSEHIADFPKYDPINFYLNMVKNGIPIAKINNITFLSGSSYFSKKNLGTLDVYLDKYIFKADGIELNIPFDQIKEAQRVNKEIHISLESDKLRFIEPWIRNTIKPGDPERIFGDFVFFHLTIEAYANLYKSMKHLINRKIPPFEIYFTQ